MEDPIIEALSQVLSPLGAERLQQVLLWARAEIRDRALIQWVQCTDGQIWEVGKQSPINEGVMLFCMLHWETANCIVAFGVEPSKNDKGQDLVLYHKTLVHNVRYATGPASDTALFKELETFLAGGPEGDQTEEGKEMVQ